MKIQDNIKRVRQALTNTKIPVIKISLPLEDVVEVFNRINSKGTQVRTSDITLAYIAAYNPTWVRSKFLKYLEELEEGGYGIEPVQLLRSLWKRRGSLGRVWRSFVQPVLVSRGGRLQLILLILAVGSSSKLVLRGLLGMRCVSALRVCPR
jgi:hypothetical protein